MAHDFAQAVNQVRRGERSAHDAAAELVALLTDAERLGLLDGDERFFLHSLDMARHGYNHEPIVAGEVERLGIPGVRFTDGPRGIVMGRSTAFPVAMARGATWDPELEEEIGRAIGVEGRAQGANLFAGVCINLLRHPAWGRAQETYGEDPVLLGEMGAALTRGVRPNLMACVKHFALNSMENARFTLDVTVDDDALHEVYLAHFRRVLEEGAEAVMSAYNSVNGQWCGDSATLLTDVLRREWGFEGFVMSDFTFGHRDPVGSVAAGLDLEMPSRQQRARALPAALADGRLARTDVHTACVRLVAAQLRHAASQDDAAPGREVVACGAHRRLARTAAARSMVLLRNEEVEGRPVLPLDADAVTRVAVIGRLSTARNLGDKGSSLVRAPQVVTIAEGLTARLGRHATVDVDDGSDPTRAAAVAAAADVAIVVVGFDATDEGEGIVVPWGDAARLLPPPVGSRAIAPLVAKALSVMERRATTVGGDRRRLTLRPEEEVLVERVAEVCPRTVVVVISGSAVLMERWRRRVPAIVMAWYPGMEGGNALADVVVGDAEPGGRLPFAVPTDEAHLPFLDIDARSITYDRWWGQRLLDRDGRAAAFPLGFGLGYTTWTSSGLAVESLDVAAESATVTVGVTNTGSRRGATVVQLYAVDDAGDPRARPRRQLVGFRRVELDAGATEQVRVPLTLRPLMRRTGPGAWELVTSRVTLEAGRHSGDPDAATTELDLGR